MRALFGRNSRMWSGSLTQAQRDRWNAAAPQVMSHPQLAQQGPLTGQQFWQAISSVRAVVGLPPDFEPPAPVVFPPSVVGRLVIENGEGGVRLWLAVSGKLNEDVLVFGQEPCPAGRSKRRNVCYLGLLPPPIGGRSEITHLYKARFGEPRPGRKVFIVTCQTRNGWKGMDRETSEIVPDRPEEHPVASEAAARELLASSKTENSQNLHMHKGCTTDAQESIPPLHRFAQEGNHPAGEAGEAATAVSSGGGPGG
jgi:hypothetical protein